MRVPIEGQQVFEQAILAALHVFAHGDPGEWTEFDYTGFEGGKYLRLNGIRVKTHTEATGERRPLTAWQELTADILAEAQSVTGQDLKASDILSWGSHLNPSPGGERLVWLPALRLTVALKAS